MSHHEKSWGFLVPVKGDASEHSLQALPPWQWADTAHGAQGTQGLLGDTGDLAVEEAGFGLDCHARGPCTEGGVGGSLMEPVWVSFPQAAELVSKNWEAYEAHMRDVRDYLEARLEVSRPALCLSLPSRSLSLQSTGPGYIPLALPTSLWPCHLIVRTELLVNTEWFTAL